VFSFTDYFFKELCALIEETYATRVLVIKVLLTSIPGLPRFVVQLQKDFFSNVFPPDAGSFIAITWILTSLFIVYINYRYVGL
jgi:hypothetical protein